MHHSLLISKPHYVVSSLRGTLITWYSQYVVPSLRGTLIKWYPTYLVFSLRCTLSTWYPHYVVPSLRGTLITWYPHYVVPSLRGNPINCISYQNSTFQLNAQCSRRKEQKRCYHWVSSVFSPTLYSLNINEVFRYYVTVCSHSTCSVPSPQIATVALC